MLDRAFAAVELLGDFFDAALFDEAGFDDAVLGGGQAFDQLEQHGGAFDGFEIGLVAEGGDGSVFAGGLAVVIGEGIAGDAEQPGDERGPLPFEAAESAEGVAEDFGGQVLGGGTVAGALDDVGVNAVEVGLVEGAEQARVALGGFDGRAFVRDLLVLGLHGAVTRVTRVGTGEVTERRDEEKEK